MILLSGFNGFRQLQCIFNLFSESNIDVKIINVGLNELTSKDSLISFCDVCSSVPYNDLVMTWSYFTYYNGDTVWICGFVNGKGNEIKTIKVPNNKLILQASCNRSQIVCVTEDGGCWQYSVHTDCWRNLAAILAIEVVGEDNGPEVPVKVCCGETVTAILTAAGGVYNMPNKLSLSKVKIVDVACGRSHIIMLSDKGEIFSAGEGSRGQLGHGELENEEEPRLVEGLAGLTVVAVACGGWHSCALTVDGDLYTWGWNMSGQLGLLTKEPGEKVSVQAVPLVVDWPDNSDVRVTKIACGSRHTVAILDDGSVWGCGWNGYGQLAQPGVDSLNCMTKLLTPSKNIKNVICGPWNTCLTF